MFSSATAANAPGSSPRAAAATSSTWGPNDGRACCGGGGGGTRGVGHEERPFVGAFQLYRSRRVCKISGVAAQEGRRMSWLTRKNNKKNTCRRRRARTHTHLNDMARLLATLDAEAGLELLLLAERDGGLYHLGPRVRRADLAPRGVRLQHQLLPRDGTQDLGRRSLLLWTQKKHIHKQGLGPAQSKVGSSKAVESGKMIHAQSLTTRRMDNN